MEEKLGIYIQFVEWQFYVDSWDLWDTTSDGCNGGYLSANNSMRCYIVAQWNKKCTDSVYIQLNWSLSSR